MSFFGLITEDWPLTLFAYIVTAIVAGIVVLVVVALVHRPSEQPPKGKGGWRKVRDWLRGRGEHRDRIWRERAFRRDHS